MDVYAAIVTAVIVVCVVACLWAVASIPLAILVGRMLRDQNEALAQQAADHGEPARADVEAGWLDESTEDWWLFEDPAFIDRPSEVVLFAAAVMATIDDLPEVRGA